LLARWNTQSKANATLEPLLEAGVGVDPWPFYQLVKDEYPHIHLVRVVWEAGTFPQELYQVNLLMGVYCRYFGDLGLLEPGCPAFFDSLSSGGVSNWTGPCCKYHNDRIREYFYPHLGDHQDWPEKAYNSMAPPYKLTQFGLKELVRQASTQCDIPAASSKSGGGSGSGVNDGLSAGATAAIVLLSLLVAGLAVVVFIMLFTRRRPSRSKGHELDFHLLSTESEDANN
jgi:hypothetical protein